MTSNNENTNATKKNAQARLVVQRIKRHTKTPATVKGLSESLNVTPSVVFQALNTLEAVGLVQSVRLERKEPTRGRPEFGFVAVGDF